jgi:hypothetical protein
VKDVKEAIDPARTTVVLVGIDVYGFGERWDLAGPSHDARRFADWFLDRGVPADRIIAHISRAESGSDDWVGHPVAPRPANRQQIRTTLVREVAAAEGDLLWVVWGGHGVVDGAQRRRLFYADATLRDRLNLDVDDLMAFYRSTAVASFRRQIWVVDACQTVIGSAPGGLDLPHETLPGGTDAGRAQELFFAAGRGERAGDLTAERTGLYSRELLQLLRQDGRWPPDVDELAARQFTRFQELRRQGLARQTPTYLWFLNSQGTGGQLMHGPSTPSLPPTARPPLGPTGRPPAGPTSAVFAVVDALTSVPAFANPSGRDLIIGLLRGEIGAAVVRTGATRMDAVSLVQTCRRFAGGPEELAQAVNLVAAGSPEADRLIKVINELLGPF